MDTEKRIEALEALLRGPTGEAREEAELRARVYDAFKSHKVERGPIPDLTEAEQEHWDLLNVYHGIARKVSGRG